MNASPKTWIFVRPCCASVGPNRPHGLHSANGLEFEAGTLWRPQHIVAVSKYRECAVCEPPVPAIGSAREKPQIHQTLQQLHAGWRIKPPETLGLLPCQLQTGHFQIFAADPADEMLMGHDGFVVHRCLLDFIGVSRPRAGLTTARRGPRRISARHQTGNWRRIALVESDWAALRKTYFCWRYRRNGDDYRGTHHSGHDVSKAPSLEYQNSRRDDDGRVECREMAARLWWDAWPSWMRHFARVD